jgi:hypothetical protein
LKYHLAKIPGHEVEIFPTTTPDVVLIAKNSILDIVKKKNQREELRKCMESQASRGWGKLDP